MAEGSAEPQSRQFEASLQTQNLRALARSHLDTIEAEDSVEEQRQVAAAHELQKYAKVRRRDRPKPSTSTSTSIPPEFKGTKLRSAQDILDRLRHDESFEIAEYRVGYLERFHGIREIPAQAWITESTDEDWIPQHRIKYVKRVHKSGDGHIVWDRDRRVDKIFGSGLATDAAT